MTDMSGDRVGVQSRSGVPQSQKDEVVSEGGVEGGISPFVCLSACFFGKPVHFFLLFSCAVYMQIHEGQCLPRTRSPLTHKPPRESHSKATFPPLSEFKIGSSMR